MTETSMFFSDGTYYSQNVFARFIRDIFGHDGVVDNIDDELEVYASTPANMSVNVSTGRSYVQGYFHEIRTDPINLEVDTADTTHNRIDRVVLHLDVNTNRKITAQILKGTPSASPVVPALTQTDAIWEIPLAKFTVRANTTSILDSDITDERELMWLNTKNMQRASGTEWGVMKAGPGLSAVDGVISVVQPVVIQHVSTTNNGGFAVGQLSGTIRSVSVDAFTPSPGWQDAGSQFTPFTAVPAYHDYPPFTVAEGITPTVSITVSWGVRLNSGSNDITCNARAVKVSDGTVLGTGTLTATSRSTTTTGTFTFDAPIDNSAVKLQVNNGDSVVVTKLMSMSITSGAVNTVYYYSPQVAD